MGRANQLAVRIDNLRNRRRRLAFRINLRWQNLARGAHVSVSYPRDLRLGSRIKLHIEHGARASMSIDTGCTFDEDLTLWFQDGGRATVGRDVQIRRWTTLIIGAPLTLADEVIISFSSFVSANYGVRIGARTGLAHHVTVVDVWHFFSDAGKHFALNNDGAPLTIGEDCWIGPGSLVLAGADIGHHNIVAGATEVRGMSAPWTLHKHAAGSERPVPPRFRRGPS